MGSTKGKGNGRKDARERIFRVVGVNGKRTKIEGTCHVVHGTMNTFDDRVGLRVLDGSRGLKNTKAVKKLLEIKTNEFTALVIDSKKRTSIAGHPDTIKSESNGLTTFVMDADDLNPTGAQINDGEDKKR